MGGGVMDAVMFAGFVTAAMFAGGGGPVQWSNKILAKKF